MTFFDVEMQLNATPSETLVQQMRESRCLTKIPFPTALAGKGRGKIRIRQALKSAHITLPDSLDALIEQARIDSLTDGTALADDDGEEVDWLRLAVEARTRKYGDSIPTTPKEKARQLRFLQYRGFEMGVCLDALKLRLSDF